MKYPLQKRICSSCAALLTAVLMLAGCSTGNPWTHVLDLELPARPAAWSFCPGLEYRVEWIDAAWNHRSAEVAEGETLRLDIPRGAPQWLRAVPLVEGHELRPAAALYPTGLVTATGTGIFGKIAVLRADFPGGYAAAVADCIEKAGYRAFEYPCDRLDVEIERLSGNSLSILQMDESQAPDPWSLAPEYVAASFLQGNFRITHFRKPEVLFSFPESPGSGCWYPESPFCNMVLTGEGGQAAVLGNGLHEFHAGDLRLVVRVENEEAAAWQFGPDSG
jgi:hypothetical protein